MDQNSIEVNKMDQNSIEYKISVMQAFKEGKQLQSKIYKDSVLSNGWKSIDTPIWDWYRCDYRVKPDEKTEYQKEVEKAFKECIKNEFR